MLCLPGLPSSTFWIFTTHGFSPPTPPSPWSSKEPSAGGRAGSHRPCSILLEASFSTSFWFICKISSFKCLLQIEKAPMPMKGDNNGVCLYVCHVCTCVCAFVCVYTCIHAGVYVCVSVHMCICACVCPH